MSRRTETMAPTAVKESALRDLARFGDVLKPGEALEPILAASVRAAVYEWMTELRAADDLAAVGLKPRRTALFYGPPGCGKTTLAHHFAARLGLPLVCVRSESLIDAYLGSTGRNIGQLFDLMTETAGQVVIFFDEIDALGGRRMSDQGSSVERANSLNVLLRRIETFAGVAMAATNRHDALDEALWRRFDLQVPIELPGPDERFAILSRYLAPFVLDEADIDALAEATSGASPALLRGVMEGIKRHLVLAPRIRRDATDARTVLETVTASVTPPPDYGDVPPLWGAGGVARLALASWPPVRPEGGEG